MGLESVVKKAVTTAFKATADLREAITIKTVTSTYDPATMVNTPSQSSVSVLAFVTRFDVAEVARSGGLISVKDRKVIIDGADVGYETLRIADKIEIGGTDYQVVQPVSGALKNSVYHMQVRSL